MEGQDQDVFFAAQSQSGGSGFGTMLLMMMVLFGAMYFLFIRPNKRRRQQVEQMQSSLGVGDEVLTIGGLYGIVEEIDGDQVWIEVAPGISNRYIRSAISQVVSSGQHDEEEAEEADEEQPAAETPDKLSKKVIDTD